MTDEQPAVPQPPYDGLSVPPIFRDREFAELPNPIRRRVQQDFDEQQRQKQNDPFRPRTEA